MCKLVAHIKLGEFGGSQLDNLLSNLYVIKGRW